MDGEHGGGNHGHPGELHQTVQKLRVSMKRDQINECKWLQKLDEKTLKKMKIFLPILQRNSKLINNKDKEKANRKGRLVHGRSKKRKKLMRWKTY